MPRSRVGSILFFVVVAALALWSGFPLYFALVSSLSTDTQLFQPHYFPPSLDLSNYADVLHRAHFLSAMLNSAIVASFAVLATLCLALPAAYAIIRLGFGGARALMLMTLAGGVMPQAAVLPGFYELTLRLGIYDTLWGVILPYLSLLLPFAVWTLSAYLRAIPAELEDMALIDGATAGQRLRLIYLPLLLPGLVAAGLISVIAAWNEFLFAFTFTMRETERTAPVAVSMLWGYTPHDTPWGAWMAACVMSTLPPIVLVAVFQRRMASGLTAWIEF